MRCLLSPVLSPIRCLTWSYEKDCLLMTLKVILRQSSPQFYIPNLKAGCCRFSLLCIEKSIKPSQCLCTPDRARADVSRCKDNRSREFEPEFSTAYRCLNLFNIVISQDPVPNFPKDLYHWGMWYRFGVTLLFESSYFSISPGDYHRPQNYINVVTNGQSYEQFQKQWKGIFISNAE